MAKIEKGESGVKKGEMVSPLCYQGNKGGNPESPSLGEPEGFEPRDPMGFLPKGAEEKGKRGPA